MALSLGKRLAGDLSALRYQSTPKRVRVDLGGEAVADTTAAVLVWEPRRIVPSYAVPERDITATLEPASPEHEAGTTDGGSSVLTPRDPFSMHTAEGDVLTVATSTQRREAAAFRLTDPDLAGYVELDFNPFDWREEDDPIVGHPRDPFHRIDIRASSRPVRIEHEGHVLAASTRTKMLFEGTFPFARYYLPLEDVVVDLVESAFVTTCAYKGQATHYSTTVGGVELKNVAWSYQDPLEDALSIRGLVSFYQERFDLFVDGERIERVATLWS